MMYGDMVSKKFNVLVSEDRTWFIDGQVPTYLLNNDVIGKLSQVLSEQSPSFLRYVQGGQ